MLRPGDRGFKDEGPVLRGDERLSSQRERGKGGKGSEGKRGKGSNAASR